MIERQTFCCPLAAIALSYFTRPNEKGVLVRRMRAQAIHVFVYEFCDGRVLGMTKYGTLIL